MYVYVHSVPIVLDKSCTVNTVQVAIYTTNLNNLN